MFSGVKQTYSRHGVYAAAKYVSCRLLQRLMILDITHLMIQDCAHVSIPSESDEIECRFLTADEIRKFAADSQSDMSSDIAGRIDSGQDFCFAGLVEGQLACYCWFALNSIEADNNRSTGSPLSGMAISYPDQFAFRYKGYTHPDFRGRRIYQRVAVEAALAMQEKGVRYILSTAEWVNFGALKSSYRSGFEYRGKLVIVVIAGKRFVYHPDLSKLDICFDKEAEVLDRELLNPGFDRKLATDGSELRNEANPWQDECLPREEGSFT